jgi:acylphosphatase
LEEKLLYKIYITGRVQGVGFRWSAANEAIARNITGYVKNMSDGSVYIEAEGAKEQLDAYVEWCRRGPGFAFVKNVTADTFPPVNYPDFRIE